MTLMSITITKMADLLLYYKKESIWFICVAFRVMNEVHSLTLNCAPSTTKQVTAVNTMKNEQLIENNGRK